MIDYIIPGKYFNFEQEESKGQFFQIKFNPKDLKYYIKDLFISSGTFRKLQSREEIKNNTLISAGNLCIIFTLGIEEEVELAENFTSKSTKDYKNCINVKVYYSNVKHAFFSFSPAKNPITIGREDCDISLEDCMLSKIHCTLTFSDNKWYITDGCYNDRGDVVKKSTNGVWVYLSEDYEIKEGMIFRSCEQLFISSFIDDYQDN